MAQLFRREKQSPMRIAPAGDEALLVDFGPVIHRDVNRRVHALAHRLEASTGGEGDGLPPGWLVELVPAYSSLLIRYDPEVIRYPQLSEAVERLARLPDDEEQARPRLVDILVRYGGDDGPDLHCVARHVGLDADEVIRRHCEPIYVVYMLGFTPGFCYLGDLDGRLAIPRRNTPRLRVPAGAVAIGGSQTGIYSLDSPGGWHWIGRTDVALWDLQRDPPFLLRPGDEVRFVPA